MSRAPDNRPAVRVLVVAPHPDDETLGCGGTIALHVDRGHAVTVVWMTAGERAAPGADSCSTPSRRREEARSAIAELGVTDGVFLDLPDGELSSSAGPAVDRLADVMIGRAPEVVYTPHPDEAHRDHAATAEITVSALRRCVDLDPILFGYEVWSPVAWPHHSEDITGVFDRKRAALSCHRSQLDQAPYEQMMSGLALYRGAMTMGCERAESFVAIPWRNER